MEIPRQNTDTQNRRAIISANFRTLRIAISSIFNFSLCTSVSLSYFSNCSPPIYSLFPSLQRVPLLISSYHSYSSAAIILVANLTEEFCLLFILASSYFVFGLDVGPVSTPLKFVDQFLVVHAAAVSTNIGYPFPFAFSCPLLIS